MEVEMVYDGDTRRYHRYTLPPNSNAQFIGNIYLPKGSVNPPERIKVTVEVMPNVEA